MPFLQSSLSTDYLRRVYLLTFNSDAEVAGGTALPELELERPDPGPRRQPRAPQRDPEEDGLAARHEELPLLQAVRHAPQGRKAVGGENASRVYYNESFLRW